MAIDAESVDQTNAAEKPALLINRTGIMVHPDLSAELIQGAKEITPASEDGDEIRVERSEYVAEASPIGSYPPAVNGDADEQTDDASATSETMALLFDKLSERLAFERQGTRLYEAFIQKLEALPNETDGASPELEEVRHICEEELEHFKLLQKSIVELGGDATVQSPSADVAGVLSHGAMQIMSDPRTTVSQALQAVLTAELADNDGWEMLQQLAEQIGYDDLATQAGEALDQEREHLDSVRTWISDRMAAELAATNGSDRAHGDQRGKPRRRTAKKKSSRSTAKRKKK